MNREAHERRGVDRTHGDRTAKHVFLSSRSLGGKAKPGKAPARYIYFRDKIRLAAPRPSSTQRDSTSIEKKVK